MAVTQRPFIYIVSQRFRRPIPCWPYRLKGAPAPSALPPHPPTPTQPCALIYASVPLLSAPNQTFFVLVLGALAKETLVKRV